MSTTKRPTYDRRLRRQIDIVVLLLLLGAVALWGTFCSPEDTPDPAPTPAASRPGAGVDFPLVRLPGTLADRAPDLVEFVVDEGQWLILVLDPDAPAVQLPTAGTWMAAAAIAPAQRLELCRENDDCVTVLSVERLD